MSFSIIMIIKKIFSVILRLSNNTKYLRPNKDDEFLLIVFFCVKNNQGMTLFRVILWFFVFNHLSVDLVSLMENREC